LKGHIKNRNLNNSFQSLSIIFKDSTSKS